MADINELVERKTKAIKLYLLNAGIYHHAKDMTKISRGLVLEVLDDPKIVMLDDDQSIPHGVFITAGCSSNLGLVDHMLKAGFKKVKTMEEK
uniref:Uncharacterized protein n=1 Tax=viral metagenome TaxID=1070528 RepID=A0A6M3LE02_9ZZZZ